MNVVSHMSPRMARKKYIINNFFVLPLQRDYPAKGQ